MGLIPNTITEEVVKNAIKTVLDTASSGLLRIVMEDLQCHIVVLVPGDMESKVADDHQVQAYVLHEQSVGKKEGWKDSYDDIAFNSALMQLWTGQNQNSDQVASILPALLLHDIQNCNLEEIKVVVSCSGPCQRFNEMVVEIIFESIVLLSYGAFVNTQECLPQEAKKESHLRSVT
ncbi:hypothetical protein ACFL22_01150 [Patescibacteria group bacterium]